MLAGLCTAGPWAWAQAEAPAAAKTTPARNQAKAPAPVAAGSVILVVGDSISAEYGLARGKGWVALLEAQLKTERVPVTVVNASVSGDTTSGGRSRLPALLKQHRPGLVIIELGGNDALRGLPLNMTRDNLAGMSRDAKAAGARVLLAGMQMPPNYGRQYAEDFAGLYAQVARQEQASLLPFVLQGVADAAQSEQWFQADRIHPNEKAQPRIMRNVLDALKPMLPRPTRG